MTLIIWFNKLSYSLGAILNSKVFAQEILIILLGGIAVTIAIPLACYITAWQLVRHKA